ncbi:hypothetical protein GCM10023185_18480 [Hymenobacter saemangeumensis]|uniref:Secretion system C-terminal sorting domain-containing protein n=1 Tax=Hymenobacter saemangeumensis TaxID=1084522 RepID=A0ABP8IC55_9BACT
MVFYGVEANAQDLYNNGAQITLTGGATLYVPGNVTNTNSGSITNNGSTMRVDGNVTNNGSGTLNLGTAGVLEVKGNVVNTATVTPGTGTLQLTGSSAQVLDLGGGSVHNLTVNNTAATPLVTVPSNVTVNNQLTLTNGMVRTAAASRVILPNGATVSGETNGRYVAGNLEVQRTAVSGASPVSFANGLTLTPNNNLGTVSVTRTAGLAPVLGTGAANVSYGVNPSDANKKGIDQIWTVVASTQPAAGSPATVALTWLSDNDNGLTSFGAARIWENMGSGWTALGPYVNATGRSISTSVTSLSRFTVSDYTAPLPVELISFTAVRQGDAARLNWRTASEKNNAYFDVQVSTDGRSFRKIMQVAGQGTTSRPTDYERSDAALLSYNADPVYYRLRQVDTDGKESFSDVRTVRVEVTGFTAVAYPNPVSQNGTTVQIRTGEAGPAELAVYDATGRLLMGVKTELFAGTNEVKLEAASRLATGAYFLKVNQGKQHTLLKLVRE